MRRCPMWKARKVLDDEWRTIYEVVRMKDFPGYPPAPAVEGRVIYHSTPLPEFIPDNESP